ncbi:hypothetical protein Ahy_B09g096724 [Arachis hypogaea]|uniref:Endonuclease/exonuclease/phosphatase domain-containing protein n=1 Tax=Arachis hypogaea TaxID=3818 RepID=A0A444XM58_ARAHY|nr:hypothetical protein Ahy_B09g096724 [Arachis hypogaea]
MSIISWNCRGLAALATISELQNLCKQIKPAIVFEIETRAKGKTVMKIRKRLHFEESFCIEPRGLSGGLCLFWNAIYNINVYFWCDNYIKARIEDKKGNIWYCNFVYGNPVFSRRKESWKDITSSNNHRDMPQLFIGDFNDVLAQEEKVRLHPKPQNQVREFRYFVDANALMDIELKGGRFTWFSNPRNGVITRERIDRALANWVWRNMFQHATLTAMPAISFDHCPIILNLEPKNKSGKSFKFESYWVDHEDCEKVVTKS